MAAGVILIAGAGTSWWTQNHTVEAPVPPALVQPTPFPTATATAEMPAPTQTIGPAAIADGIQATATSEGTQATAIPEGTPTPVALPTIPGGTAPVSGNIPAKSPPTRIVIPSIGLDAPVVEVGWVVVERNDAQVTEWKVADYAAGFHQGSAYPGNPGNTVLSGHHNIRGKVFRYLVNVAEGDEIVLYAEDRAYYYRVESKAILPEKYASDEQRTANAQLIGYYPDDRLTLITCWPYTSNTHRVVVIAKPVLAPAAQ